MDSSEKLISTSISISKKFIKNFENNLSGFKEKENSEEKNNSDNTTSQSQINASSLKSTILDHPYPIMTLAKTVQNINKSSCQQSEQHTEHPASIEDPTNLTCVEILSETGNQMDSENAESTSKADQKTPMSEGEINLLMKQQEQLIKQQGQMLQVLQELKDIQKEILGLKRKNHELKLTKLRIAAQQAGIKVITKANK